MDSILQVSIPFDLLSSDDAEYDKQAKTLVNKLQKDAPEDVTNANYLDTLDPSSQTIIFVYVLNAHISEAGAGKGKAVQSVPSAAHPEGGLWPYITRLLLTFDPTQVRYIGEPFFRIVSAVADGAEQTSNLIPAIQLLSNVILRLDPSSSTLTTTHFRYVRLCLLARAYSDAAQILDLPIYSIPSESDKPTQARTYKYLCSNHESSSTYLSPATGLTMKFTSRKYLKYYLMAGMCYMGLRQYTKAIFCLEAVLTAPTAQNTASMLMVEAYKKWLLLGLLLRGKIPSKPDALLQSTFKLLRAIAKPYDCLAEAFKSRNITRLQGEAHEGQEFWEQDCNTALVFEVLQAFRKFAVVNLGKTFAALSLAEVARQTSPDSSDLSETTAYISTLITTGQLYASLVPATQAGQSPILRFLASPATSMSETQIQRELALKTLELQDLFKQVSDNDHKLELNKDYIEYLKKMKKQKEQDLKDGALKTATFEDIDEDMMGDF